MSRVATGIVLMALALVGALRVLVVTGRAIRRATLTAGCAIASVARWMARRYRARATRQAKLLRQIEVRADMLREQNRREIARFSNRPRGPSI